MGSGDLNLLKSWNPKLVKNRKKVWEKEQELLKEEQKLLERRKEIEKERELNELINTERDPLKQHETKQEKLHKGLDWMYEKTSFDENEEYLLGQKKLDSNVIKIQSIEDPLKKKLESDETRPKEKKKINYSMDDPMAKFNLAKSKLKKSGKITKKTNNNKKVKSNTIDY